MEDIITEYTGIYVQVSHVVSMFPLSHYNEVCSFYAIALKHNSPGYVFDYSMH